MFEDVNEPVLVGLVGLVRLNSAIAGCLPMQTVTLKHSVPVKIIFHFQFIGKKVRKSKY